jgi:hypothetical protein
MREYFGGLGRGPQGVKMAQFVDGTSNTIIVAEGAGRPNFYLTVARSRSTQRAVLLLEQLM